MKVTLRKSLPYGLIAVCGALVQQIDIFILSSLVDDINMIEYAVVAKVMTFFAFMSNVIISNNWAPCSEASSSKNWKKADTILWNVIYGGLGIIFTGAIFCLLLNNTISTMLTDGKVSNISPVYWISFSLMMAIRFWSDSFMMLIQGLGLTRIFLYYLPAQALLSVFFQIILTKNYGAIGVILGQMVAFLLTSAWILPYYYKRISYE
jgi:O-antigen/teichoic acid export membrane protein